MAYNETFDSGLGTYTITSGLPTDGQWTGSAGNTSAGCVALYYPNDGGSLQNIVGTHTILSGDYIYFNFRVVGSTVSTGSLIEVQAWQGASLLLSQGPLATISSAWQQYALPIGGLGSYISKLNIAVYPQANDQTEPYTVYIDSIVIGPDAPPFDSGEVIPEDPMLGAGRLYYGFDGLQAYKELAE